jgi:hypothetical protein
MCGGELCVKIEPGNNGPKLGIFRSRMNFHLPGPDTSDPNLNLQSSVEV